jgi:hypothetical protein
MWAAAPLCRAVSHSSARERASSSSGVNTEGQAVPFHCSARSERGRISACVFRMKRSTFTYLLNVLLPDLLRDVSMALRSSGGRIEPEIRLALTLRLLAGASYLDTVMLFAISRSSCYAVFNETINSILSRL